MSSKFAAIFRFDPFLCSQEYTSKKLNLIEAGRSMVDALPKKGFIIRLASFLNAYLRLSYKNIKNISLSTRYHIFVANNDSELNALMPIAENFNKSEIVWLGLSAKKLGREYLAFNPGSGYLLGLLLIPIVLVKICLASDNKKAAAPYIFDSLLYGMGFLIPFELLLKKLEVKSVYISNHNAPLSALMVEICAGNDITTTYIEHTIIVDRWPEIKCHNFLLSGMFSKLNLDLVNEYRRNCSVELIGSPRNDSLNVKQNISNISSIGIGINTADDRQKVIRLVKDLSISLPNIQLYIRPHPAMKLHSSIVEICQEYGAHVSSPSKKSLNHFFGLIDVLVVNDSGLYFEAGYAGIVPLKFNLSVHHSEYTVPDKFYKGLFKESGDLVLTILSLNLNRSDCRSEFRAIYHNIGTQFDQNSTRALKQSLDNLGLY